MRKLKLSFVISLVICLLFTSVTVFAVTQTDSSEDVVTTTQDEGVSTEPSTEENEQTTTEPQTDEETTEDDAGDESENSGPKPSPSRWNLSSTSSSKPPKTTEDRQNNEDNNQGDEEPEDNAPEVVETEIILEEDEFYVYLERNNGQRRLRKILNEPSVIKEPTTPERKGYIFDGWYADAKFKKKWNFETDLAEKGTVIYAKWVADSDTVVFDITVKKTSGGYLEVNPAEACKDEPVIINVYPKDGMRLVSGSIKINGVSTDILNFIMPAEDVMIEAKFEKIPEKANEEEKGSILPFVIGGIVILVAVVIVILVIRSRKDDFEEDEIDENGTVIDTELDDKSWVDETLVVEDAFKDGEMVKGNVIPEDDFYDELFDDGE